MTEFGLIDQIKGLFAAIPTNNFEGIGDDCAVLPLGDESLLFTTDMLIEDVHFLRRSTSAFDLGYKSLAVNLSDVAAMGVAPIASLLSLSVPKELMGDYIEEFMRGYHSLSEEFGVALIGGDTTASKGGLSINVTAIGRGKNQNIKRRSGARIGDIIVVNNLLGDSGAGLKDIFSGDNRSPLATIHKRPAPQINEGVWLGERASVHAMMDISDGVASDIRHILKLSGVGATIDLDTIPTNHDLHTALCAGEDYKLLLTVEASQFETLRSNYRTQFGGELYPIGRVTEGDSLEWTKDGQVQDISLMGFRHY